MMLEIIAVTAFGLRWPGIFNGIVVAGKSLYIGFADFGFKIGMTNAAKMGIVGYGSYKAGDVTDTYIINPLKKNLIYDPLNNTTDGAIDVNTEGTNIENIRNGTLDNNPGNPVDPINNIRQ